MLIETDARIEDFEDGLVARQCISPLEPSFFAIEVPDEIAIGASGESDSPVGGVGVHFRAKGCDFAGEQDAAGDGAPAHLFRGCDHEADVASNSPSAVDDGDAHMGTPVPGTNEARRHDEVR